MRKIYSLVLTVAMLLASVMPAYAGEGSMVTKSLFIETMKNTIDTIGTEMYGKGYLKEYENASDEFLKKLNDGSKVTLDVTNVYNFDDDVTKVAVNFVYNDDGKSIKIDMKPTATDSDYADATTGSIYIDDKILLIDIPSVSEDKLVYHFKGAGQDMVDGVDMSYFKYSNIKKYINIVLDLETSGKLDKIVKDYKDNFLLYLSNADFTQIDNTITVSVDADLLRAYLGQLGTKIANDKNLKQIFESLEVGHDISYRDVTDSISEALNQIATGVDDNFEIKYFGVMENNVFVKNKISVTTRENTTEILSVEFNDPKNGLLSSGIITLSDSYSDDNTTINFNLTDNKVGKVISFKVFGNSELVSEGAYNYSIDGMKIVANSEITTYTEPYFNITEEPVKDTPISYNEWLKNEKEHVAFTVNYYRTNLADAKSEKTRIENAITNNEDVSIPYGTDFWNNEFKWVVKYSYPYDSSELINDEGLIISKEKYLEVVNEYLNNSQNAYNDVLAESEQFDSLDHKAEYQTYLDDIDYYYNNDLQEYNRYLAYEGGEQTKDITKFVSTTEQRLTDTRLIAKQKQEIYLNDELQSGSITDITIEVSTETNKVDTKNAVKLTEFLGVN